MCDAIFLAEYTALFAHIFRMQCIDLVLLLQDYVHDFLQILSSNVLLNDIQVYSHLCY